MTQYAQHMADAGDLSLADQKQAGKALHGDLGDEQRNFLKTLIGLIDSKEIDPTDPQTFLQRSVYDSLDQKWKDQTDLALLNIAHQVQMIEEFYRSKETPNESPHLRNMVEHLWLMKQRIEEHHDVFKF